MKITGVETFVLQGQLQAKGFGWSQRVTDRRQTALCVVTTDEGINGLGEAFYYATPAKIVTELITDGYAPLLIDRDPFDTAVIWDFLYKWTRDQGMKAYQSRP
jgi:D-galactarolactone cycloisomerase